MTHIWCRSFISLWHFGRYFFNMLNGLFFPAPPLVCIQVGYLSPILSTNALAFAAISTDLSVNETRSGGVCEPVHIVPASFSINSLAEIFPSIASSSESRSEGGAWDGPPTVLTDLTMLLDSRTNVNLFTNR